jgi:serine/threonine-protein kinase RsbW
MRMKVAFCLPPRPESISMARQLIDWILKIFDVQAECRREIALAVSEACTNVVTHATGATMYELIAESEGSDCVITVEDDGVGADQLPSGMPSAESVAGRGISIILLMMDRLDIGRATRGGLSVRMFKRLRWSDGPANG